MDIIENGGQAANKTQYKYTQSFLKNNFNFIEITQKINNAEMEQLTTTPDIKSNSDVLKILFNDVQRVNFKAIIYPNATEDKNPTDRQKYVAIIDELLNLANKRQWGICKNGAFVYLFNGAFWCELDKEILQDFLGKCAARMGIIKHNAKQYIVKEHLFKQFLSTGFQAMPENNEKTLINLKNGTYEIDKDGKGRLRDVNKDDFIKYQLPFEYNPDAECPKFQEYLDVSLPDKEAQNVLAEFIGYVFARNLKLEKGLILLGSGANGKSVFFEIIFALLGSQNVSSYSIDTLCEHNGYYRAMIANKLVNYSSEIGKRFEVDKYKKLCSGEPIEARLPYGHPFLISNYARLIFNANLLPKEIEQTDAYFRRFLIIPFTVTIAPEKQDIELSKKIIDNELSGVFNWVLRGLDRIIQQKGFSKCKAAESELEQYRLENDSIAAFIDENNYQPSVTENMKLQVLYNDYYFFCHENNYRPCGRNVFSECLKKQNFDIKKVRGGRDIYIEVKTETTDNETSS